MDDDFLENTSFLEMGERWSISRQSYHGLQYEGLRGSNFAANRALASIKYYRFLKSTNIHPLLQIIAPPPLFEGILGVQRLVWEDCLGKEDSTRGKFIGAGGFIFSLK